MASSTSTSLEIIRAERFLVENIYRNLYLVIFTIPVGCSVSSEAATSVVTFVENEVVIDREIRARHLILVLVDALNSVYIRVKHDPILYNRVVGLATDSCDPLVIYILRNSSFSYSHHPLSLVNF